MIYLTSRFNGSPWQNFSIIHHTFQQLRCLPFKLYMVFFLLSMPYLPKDSLVKAVDHFMSDKKAIISLLKHHLRRVADRMKKMADKNRIDREFTVGDMVFLKFRSYMEHSMPCSHHKLHHHYYGPYKILECIGSIAYMLQLSKDAKIHKCFSCFIA